MLEQWLRDAGYHVDMRGDCDMEVYKHGNYAGHFYRYDRRADWRCLHLGKIVTLSNYRKMVKC